MQSTCQSHAAELLPANCRAHHIPANYRADHIVVAVCTCKRPKMLRRCLESLSKQIVDDRTFVTLLVIDNEATPNNRHIVEQIAPHSPFPLLYHHEPQRGIPFARNAALDRAAALRADWLAFIDDDEVAERRWIAGLMAEEYHAVPVLMGCQKLVYPEPYPFWALEKSVKGSEGETLKVAYTNNVRMSAKVISSGLRFDESIGLGQGSDSDFFCRAHNLGLEIRRTLKAITYEHVPTERLTYGWQMHRAYCVATARARTLVKERGWTRAALRYVHTILLNAVIGIAQLALSPLMLLAGITAFKRAALSGGCKIAKSCGRVATLIGKVPQPYLKIVDQ